MFFQNTFNVPNVSFATHLETEAHMVTNQEAQKFAYTAQGPTEHITEFFFSFISLYCKCFLPDGVHKMFCKQIQSPSA